MSKRPCSSGSDPVPAALQVKETIKRDLRRISQNLVLVVFPFNSGREEQQAALRNWDLWGPMVRPPLPSAQVKVRPERLLHVMSSKCRRCSMALTAAITVVAYFNKCICRQLLNTTCAACAQFFTLLLASCLSIGAPAPSSVFSVCVLVMRHS